MRSEEEVRRILIGAIEYKDLLFATGTTREAYEEFLNCLKWVLNEQDDKVH